jgi:hypothetical protein
MLQPCRAPLYKKWHATRGPRLSQRFSFVQQST